MTAETPEQHPTDPPEETPEVLQPSDVVQGETADGKVVRLPVQRGSLSIAPGQKNLTDAQKEALVSIGIDTSEDPGVVSQIRPFFHMCDVRGLDPFQREAYLIGRGTGNSRKWTMQVGIDGYRKMGANTGRFIRVKKRLWTGADDDETSWVQVEDEDGDVIRKRVWYDQWPEAKGHPGAAKVVIEHLDQQGNRTTSDAIADWNFYAPFNDVWDGPRGNRRKVIGPDGKPVRELSDMWAKGFQHMLSKCAEALAYRAAGLVSGGVYLAEEMHRLDAQEQDRQVEQSRSRIVQAHAVATQQEPVAIGEVVEGVVAEAKPDVVSVEPESPVSREYPAEAWRTELEWQAEQLGLAVRAMMPVKRMMTATKKDLDGFDAGQVKATVAMIRPVVVNALQQRGDTDAADAYASADPDVPYGTPPTDDDLNVDPHEPHVYVDGGGICAVEGCGLFEDETIHEGP